MQYHDILSARKVPEAVASERSQQSRVAKAKESLDKSII
jgi:hypothetical protein